MDPILSGIGSVVKTTKFINSGHQLISNVLGFDSSNYAVSALFWHYLNNAQFTSTGTFMKWSLFSATSPVLYDFLVTVKAAPHECVIRTGQS